MTSSIKRVPLEPLCAKTDQHPEHWRRLLMRGSWFPYLPTDLQESLLRLSVLKKLKKGRYLFRKGDLPNGVYVILTGVVCVATTTGVGNDVREIVLIVLQSSQWFGEGGLFEKKNVRTHDAYTQSTTSLLHFPQKSLEDLLEAHPKYWKNFGALVAGKLRVSFQTLDDVKVMSASARLATRILDMADGFGWSAREDQNHLNLLIPISQEQLANNLGYSRQTVNLLLRKMQDAQLIRLRRGYLEIHDLVLFRRETASFRSNPI